MKTTETYQVPEALENRMRLSDFIGGKFRSVSSRKGMKKAIDKGLVTINGNVAKTGDWLTGGEAIMLCIPESSKPSLELGLKVLYEDDYLAIINKPAGIEVSGNRRLTMENALSFNLKPSDKPDAVYPQPVHRLDYPTSGLLLIGKTNKSVLDLNRLFEERKIKKKYHAICTGKIEDKGRIEDPIDGKPSVSTYEVLSRLESNKYGGLSLLHLSLETGRRHQLRKHLLSIGNPILGDQKYGFEGQIMKGSGLYLHASSLSFEHPFTNEKILIESQLPKKFRKLFP